jgi:hypothetical protein
VAAEDVSTVGRWLRGMRYFAMPGGVYVDADEGIPDAREVMQV